MSLTLTSTFSTVRNLYTTVKQTLWTRYFSFFSDTREILNQTDGSNQFPQYRDYCHVATGKFLVSVCDVITFYLLREAEAQTTVSSPHPLGAPEILSGATPAPQNRDPRYFLCSEERYRV
jgi:hypothetical protein